MSWLKLQVAFCLMVFGLGFLGCVLWWNTSTHLQNSLERERFAEILQRRDRLLEALLHSSGLVSGDKTGALEEVLRPTLRKIRQSLKTGKRQNLEHLELPLPSSAGVFVSVRGKMAFHKGRAFEEVFGKDWATDFFFGVGRGGRLLEERSRILHVYSLSEQEFWRTRGQFQILYVYEHSVLKYFERTGNQDWMLLVDLNSLKSEEAVFAVQQYLSGLPGIVPSMADGFGGEALNTEAQAGLWFVNPSPGFGEWLGTHSWLLLGGLLLLGLLVKSGGWLLWQSRFSFRIGMLFLGIYFLIALVATYYHQENLKIQRVLIHENAVQMARRALVGLESGYRGFPQKMETVLHDSLGHFDREGHLLPLAMDYVIAQPLQGKVFYAADEDELPGQLLIQAWPVVSVACMGLPRISGHEYRLREMVEDRTGPEVLMYAEQEIMRWQNLSDREFERKMVPFRFLREGLYSYWECSGKPEDPTVLVGMAGGAQLQWNYLLEAFEDSMKSFPYLAVFRPHRQDQFRIFHQEFSAEADLADLYYLGGARKNILTDFPLGQRQMKGVFFSSSLFNGVDFVAAWPQEELYAPLKATQDGFRLRLFSGLFLLILTWFWACLRILNPIRALHNGFRQLKEKGRASPLPFHSRDEGGRLVMSWNLLLGELARREEMSSYVSPGLRRFLARPELLKTGIHEKASVLFSDIRSFTTLSEIQTPEDVVGMLNEYFSLWQECVEREGGIVDRFVGDALRAVFVSSQVPRPQEAATNAALSMHMRLKSWNHERERQGLLAIRMGVGIASGEISMAVLSGEKRMDIRLQGEACQRAEALEVASKQGTSTAIFLDLPTAEELADTFTLKRVEADTFEVLESD